MRRLLIVTVLGLVLGALPGVPRAAHASPYVTQIGQYYLALGDSYGYGYIDANTPPDPYCQAPTAPGYVCVFYRALKTINKNLQLVNMSVPGAGSCILIYGTLAGSPCPNPLHAPAVPSPLDAAVAFIKAHPGQVNPVTIDIGGDDLLPLVPRAITDPAGTAALLPTVLQNYQKNLDTILAALQAAGGPNLNVIVIGQPNPLIGLSTAGLPAGLADLAASALTNLDAIMRAEAAKYGDRFIDEMAVFNAVASQGPGLFMAAQSLAGGDITKLNIHPTPAGYALYGQAVLAGSGYAGVVLGAFLPSSGRAPGYALTRV